MKQSTFVIITIFAIFWGITRTFVFPDTANYARTPAEGITRSEEIAAGTARINNSLKLYCASHAGC